MVIHGVKPQTQLKIDALLFGLLSLVTLSAVMEHAADATHARFMWHVLHGISGAAMSCILALHLFLHWPWIRSQLARLFSKHDGVAEGVHE